MMRVACALAFAGLAAAQSATPAAVTGYGECGGVTYTGATDCVDGYYCSTVNQYYAQCVPGTATTTAASSTTVAPIALCTAGCGKVEYAGTNMAGFDFGCSSDGTCNVGGNYDIVRDDDGLQQMDHLASLGLNAFRLPVSWQYLVGSVVGGPLNQTNFNEYDKLVQGCLNSGADWCEIDIHNYARWNGLIINQDAGAPTNAQFANLWSQIAAYYKDEPRIAFGIMNEPHDVPDIVAWAATVQAAVTAIREAGATTQMILLPGNNWTSAQTFISNGSAAALSNVTNPDGSLTGLIMDVHKYLDSDNSGTSSECVTNNIDDAFEPLAQWLRTNGRQAFLSETGGGNTASCELYLCQQLAYLNQNSDVYLGWTGWAAGGFAIGYPLAETPTETNGVWVDTPLVTQCVLGAWSSGYVAPTGTIATA